MDVKPNDKRPEFTQEDAYRRAERCFHDEQCPIISRSKEVEVLKK